MPFVRITLKKKTFDKASLFLAIGLAFLTSFVGVLFFSTSLSPLYGGSHFDTVSADSNYFLYEATLLLQGKRPYLDFYDHKGLFNILLDALGLLIGGKYGVMLLEAIFAGTGLMALNLALERKKRGFWPFLLVSGLYLLFASILGAGNQEGEWLFPFVAWSLYFVLGYFEDGRLVSLSLGAFLAGLEIAFSINDRPSDAIYGGALGLAFLLLAIKRKRTKAILSAVIAGVLGFGIGIAPFLTAAHLGGYLSAMLSALMDNFAYATRPKEINVLVIGYAVPPILIALALLRFRYIKNRNGNEENTYIFFSEIISLLIYWALCPAPTYYWGYLPVLILAIAFFFGEVDKSKIIVNSQKASWTSLILFSLVNVLVISLYYSVGFQDFSLALSKEDEECVLSISEDIRKTEGKVYALDCDANVYLVGEISNTTIPYQVNQSWWALTNDTVKNSVKGYLSSSTRPEYLFVAKNKARTFETFGDVISSYYVPSSYQEGAHFSIYVSR